MKHMARIGSLIAALVVSPGVFGAEVDDNRLVHEGVVNAPLDQVWAAYTTKVGLESWMVAHAEIDLKLGGTMKTRYDSKGRVDDARRHRKHDSQL